MGNCYCQKSNTLNTDVDVDGHDLKRSSTQNPKRLLRIKSYTENYMIINNINIVATLYKKIDYLDCINKSDEKPTDDNTKNINDSLIIEYEINEKEQALIKQALYKYILFEDMNDEIL